MRYWIGIATAMTIAVAAASSGRATVQPVDPLIDRGRYLVGFGSCNDCHTSGWRESDGSVPVSQWMVGTKIGYRGPWGTSYPANVRLEFSRIS
jgi:mono/diheme cytochrome c family protein